MEEQKMAEDNLILKVRVGSDLYGTATAKSDADYMGIFMPNEEYVLGTGKCEQVEIRTNPANSGHRNTKDDIDTVLYSLPKFFKLASENNPNIIEIFFTPEKNIVYKNELGQRLLDAKDLFVSKKAKHTFLGYAFGQRKLLVGKRDRYEAYKTAFDKIEKFEEQGVTELADRLVLTSEIREDGQWATFEKGQSILKVKKQLEDHLAEYGGRLEYIKKFGYDVKFASHLIRLLDEGLQLLVEGKLDFPLPQNNLVRDIKVGKWPLDKVLELADSKEKLVEDAYIRSSLPHTADLKGIELLQIAMLKEFWGYK